MLYENGVDKLICLNTNISELYRELHEMTRTLTECNRESVIFDRLYVKELLWKKEDVVAMYDRLLVQLCINECFDLKSVITGEYKYTYEEVENAVVAFNEKYSVNILIKEVCKELQFTYGIDMEITRTARV
ncbi:hypothetical protein CON65_13730 [Bacillus pseudomycoides]|uniref:Group-specific protein n=1 Tax=Bacillus pseudomycoides TaxID=64104 RepID=A0AA91VBD3_9BACI|nr:MULTISPECIES: hypothetical protein [Bacillus]PEB56804.1 hypothetical protein COO03_00495 [Bacillus sp. AFS098217]PED82080.1 hypothetical protein CON65_13730 [Bacillus pseudomycoides]PEU06524.1 hypothetical protein CN524_22985 [Bacillus sp. AFS019443]PEU18504.1 hypothetical protein CN525_11430 [Bacillus sp. AFS014408]PFW62838.1 hypothetical protein COL20_10965 [Bacillus sp. AFS075034]